MIPLCSLPIYAGSSFFNINLDINIVDFVEFISIENCIVQEKQKKGFVEINFDEG